MKRSYKIALVCILGIALLLGYKYYNKQKEIQDLKQLVTDCGYELRIDNGSAQNPYKQVYFTKDNKFFVFDLNEKAYKYCDQELGKCYVEAIYQEEKLTYYLDNAFSDDCMWLDTGNKEKFDSSSGEKCTSFDKTDIQTSMENELKLFNQDFAGMIDMANRLDKKGI